MDEFHHKTNNLRVMTVAMRWVVAAILFICSILPLEALLNSGFVRSSRSSRSSVLRWQRESSIILRAIEHVTTTEEFEQITSKSTSTIPVIIDFQKSACKPCIKVAPAFEALSKQYEGKAKFYKVDADSSKDALALMKTMGVRSVPTFHIWNAGERIESIQGAHLDEVECTLKRELDKQNETK